MRAPFVVRIRPVAAAADRAVAQPGAHRIQLTPNGEIAQPLSEFRGAKCGAPLDFGYARVR